ncbi:MAG: VOC family protein [Candidatus Obscuribacterales bacterium]|nr:VOC family protein [Candidatus Obscuribacterales bacterium]
MASELDLELASVRIFVTDLNRALHFYRDVLGLTPTSGSIETGNLVFNAGPVGSVVLECVDSGTSAGSACGGVAAGGLVGRFTGISFSVANMFNAFNHLRENQVSVTGPPEKQPMGGTLLTFFDPDGNGLTLVQYKQEPAAKDDDSSVAASIAAAVDAATARAMEMMENMEQKIASMEESAAAARDLNDDKTASIAQNEKIDDELTQLKRKAGKLPPPRVVTGDDDAQLPAVIVDDNIDQLPARPCDLDVSDSE